jgi:putative Holliday junction resolvase
MARIMAFDYGKKRVGIAVTDPLQIIATSLDTVESKEVFPFIEKYLKTEEVETFLVGLPLNTGYQENEVMPLVRAFIDALQKKYPQIPTKTLDERFTSKMATKTILLSGVNKKARQNKETVDKVSATILLQSFMEMKH